MSELHFDPSQHPDIAPRSALPAGEYRVVVDSAEEKTSGPTSKTPGTKYLSLTFRVVEGEHMGRKLWSNLNLWNPNPEVAAMSKSELATICRAVAITGPIKHTSELLSRPLLVKVKVKDGGNKIEGYRSAAGQPVAAAATGPKPWEKR